MSKKSKLSPIATAVGVSVVATLASMPIANAASNPFAASDLGAGYQVANEGSCGGMKKDAKMKGDGKCGGDIKGKKDGNCGGDMKGKKMKKDGNCGGDMKGKKMKKDGKCGEGKCGGKK